MLGVALSSLAARDCDALSPARDRVADVDGLDGALELGRADTLGAYLRQPGADRSASFLGRRLVTQHVIGKRGQLFQIVLHVLHALILCRPESRRKVMTRHTLARHDSIHE